MCLACQMEDELWFAYLDQVARQEKQPAADAAEPAKGEATPETTAETKPATKPETRPAPSSPFACEELPSE
jgi:septal ring-binding cell division protein DamX